MGCVLAWGQATSEGGLAWCGVGWASVLPSEADSVTAELPAVNMVLRMERKSYRHRLQVTAFQVSKQLDIKRGKRIRVVAEINGIS